MLCTSSHSTTSSIMMSPHYHKIAAIAPCIMFPQLYSKAGKFREMSGKWGCLQSSCPFVFVRIEIFPRNSSIRLPHWLQISHWVIHNVSMVFFFKYLSNQFLFLLCNGQVLSSSFYCTNVLLKVILHTNASPVLSGEARFKIATNDPSPLIFTSLLSPSRIGPRWPVWSWQKWWGFSSEVRLWKASLFPSWTISSRTWESQLPHPEDAQQP